MIDEDRDDFAKPDTNGADVLFSMFDKQTRAIIEKSVLEYNNKEPETTLEQFILPKERITKKGDNPESDDVEFDYTKIDPDILKKIEKSDFKDYCKENVKERSYWTFGKKQTMDQVLSYSKTMHGPILSIPKEVEGLAMKNFKRINAIINEKASKTAATNIIKRMIKMAVKNSAELRDEVFFQLIKQVRANNKQDCCYQAWSLLSVVCCFICPSESSIYYLLNYIKFMIDNFRDDEVKRSAKFVFVRLLKGYLTRGRGVLPCTAEIDLIRKKQKLSCRINLFTNGYLTVYFENYTVISDILKQICHMMEIDKEHFSKFGLLEVTTKPGMQVEETFVEEFIKLADVLASWEHEKLFYQRKTGVSFESKFELYFKIRFYFPLEKSVFRDSLLLYNECCYIFKNCHSELTSTELIQLMALHLQILFGDVNEVKTDMLKKLLYDQDQIPHFKCKTTYKDGREELVRAVIEQHTELKGKKRHDCRLEFIDILTNKDSFGRNFYTVKVDMLSQNLNQLPDDLILGLGPDNLRIMDSKYKKLIDIQYVEMQKWGYSDVLFTILFGNQDEPPSKIVLQTSLSTCISHTLATYADYMMGVSPKENSLVVSATCKMIIAATDFFKRVNRYELARQEEEDSDEELVAES